MDFRSFIEQLHNSGELLHIAQTVNPQFELAALLKQAEARGKAIVFESVENSAFPAVGGVFASPQRLCEALDNSGNSGDSGRYELANVSQDDHAALVKAAIAQPIAAVITKQPACKHTILTGAEADCSTLPIPTFFSGDSGPFLTAAVGIARNPDNQILNAGFYRVLFIAPGQVAVSVSPGSDLHGFITSAAKQGLKVPLALVLGPEPAVLMAAAAKVPASISELDVAGGLQNAPIELAQAESLDLQVPASSEFVIEVELDPTATMDNTMGEFGDLYGDQKAFLADVQVITHRHSPVFHTIMAGAGKEHNQLGFIILYGVEPDLRRELSVGFPEVKDVRVLFNPPSMGARGDVFVVMSGGRRVNAQSLFQHIYSLKCGGYPMQRIIRRVVLVDQDISPDSASQRQWVVAARATRAKDYMHVDAPGGGVCIGIDARAREGEQRLVIPGEEAVKLDDYLG